MKINAGPVSSVSFSRNGKYVVSADEEFVHIWDAMTGKEIDRNKYGEKISAVAFSPDGLLVFSGCYDFGVCILDASNGNEKARVDHNERLHLSMSVRTVSM